MSIAPILKEIGRGREGARHMSQAQAETVFAQALRGQVSGIELGAFCAAMRIKGETAEEMAGFLAATAQVQRESGLRLQAASLIPIVLPSYNGSRRLPTLTPLLALLLQQQGVPVLVHGMATEDGRVHAFEVFAQLGHYPSISDAALQSGELRLMDTSALNPGLARLLNVRRVMGLRNSAHSLVKLMNPFEGRALLVGSYTHPEYAVSMRAVFERIKANALLLRGTEGEPVADPRRAVALDAFDEGAHARLQDAASGVVIELPELPSADAAATARWTLGVLNGEHAAPAPVLLQVQHLVAWRQRLLARAPLAVPVFNPQAECA